MSYTQHHAADRLRAEVSRLEGRVRELTKPRSTEEMNALSAAMSRADAVARQFGETATKPVPGETAQQYRRRLLGHFQKHSPQFASARMDALDPSLLDAVERQVYADATHAARQPGSYKPGELRPVVEFDAGGRQITRFVGDPMAWMAPFMTQGASGRFVRSDR